MNTKIFFLIIGFLFSILMPQFSFADIYIPTDEYVGYFDSDRIYTVVGNVKNSLNYDIIPTVSVSVKDDVKLFSKTIQLMPLNSDSETPFKIKFPEVSGTPTLIPAEISFEKTTTEIIPLEIIYDDTLIVHEDGHLTGRVINTGNETISNIDIFAVIHGFENETLDVGQSISTIVGMKPGEIRDFTMYPDPTIASEVWYYSCFAVGQDSIIVLNVPRNDETFLVRYDSGILLAYPEFDAQGEDLTFFISKGWPLQSTIIFEFPRYSETESFEVFLNDEKIDSIQSIDEMGNWHVSLSVEEQSSGYLTISGFDPKGELIETLFIPEWIRNEANWWSTNQSTDEDFLKGIKFLLENKIISNSFEDDIDESEQQIPRWVKYSAGWWVEEKISDFEFLSMIENLVKREIIVI